MRQIKLPLMVLSLIAIFGISGCGSESQELNFTTTSASPNLLSGQTKSCVARFSSGTNDISAKYFQLNKPVLKWSNTKSTLYIDAITIKVSSNNISGGSYSCLLSGTELLTAFGLPTTGDFTMNPAASETSPTTLTGVCPLICGGVSLSTDQAMSGTATLKISGYAVDSTGEGVSVRSSFSFSLTYDPI